VTFVLLYSLVRSSHCSFLAGCSTGCTNAASKRHGFKGCGKLPGNDVLKRYEVADC
jgi:hypothetical protein